MQTTRNTIHGPVIDRTALEAKARSLVGPHSEWVQSATIFGCTCSQWFPEADSLRAHQAAPGHRNGPSRTVTAGFSFEASCDAPEAGLVSGAKYTVRSMRRLSPTLTEVFIEATDAQAQWVTFEQWITFDLFCRSIRHVPVDGQAASPGPAALPPEVCALLPPGLAASLPTPGECAEPSPEHQPYTHATLWQVVTTTFDAGLKFIEPIELDMATASTRDAWDLVKVLRAAGLGRQCSMEIPDDEQSVLLTWWPAARGVGPRALIAIEADGLLRVSYDGPLPPSSAAPEMKPPVVVVTQSDAVDGLTRFDAELSSMCTPTDLWARVWGKLLSGGGAPRSRLAEKMESAEHPLDVHDIAEAVVKGGPAVAVVKGDLATVTLDGVTLAQFVFDGDQLRATGPAVPPPTPRVVVRGVEEGTDRLWRYVQARLDGVEPVPAWRTAWAEEHPKDPVQAMEHHMRCRLCFEPFDMRDLNQVIAHEHSGPREVVATGPGRVKPDTAVMVDAIFERIRPEPELSSAEGAFLARVRAALNVVVEAHRADSGALRIVHRSPNGCVAAVDVRLDRFSAGFATLLEYRGVLPPLATSVVERSTDDAVELLEEFFGDLQGREPWVTWMGAVGSPLEVDGDASDGPYALDIIGIVYEPKVAGGVRVAWVPTSLTYKRVGAVSAPERAVSHRIDSFARRSGSTRVAGPVTRVAGDRILRPTPAVEE